MATKKGRGKLATKPGSGFTKEETAAMRQRVKEMRARARAGVADGEADVRAKFAEMSASDRAMAERLHAIVKEHAPQLVPRTWYGMPAYTKDGEIVFHFKPAEKFGERYASLGFSDEANLDQGHMWPVAFALTGVTGPEEAQIVALLKKAIG